jgi:hypothetical protein
MTADLEALVVAGYVFADGYSVPACPGCPAKVCDAELVALAVCQAAITRSSPPTRRSTSRSPTS